MWSLKTNKKLGTSCLLELSDTMRVCSMFRGFLFIFHEIDFINATLSAEQQA